MEFSCKTSVHVSSLQSLLPSIVFSEKPLTCILADGGCGGDSGEFAGWGSAGCAGGESVCEVLQNQDLLSVSFVLLSANIYKIYCNF